MVVLASNSCIRDNRGTLLGSNPHKIWAVGPKELVCVLADVLASLGDDDFGVGVGVGVSVGMGVNKGACL